MALKWDDIDLDKGILKVTKSIQYIPGEGLSDKAPKTETSIRDMSLPPSVITLLRYYLLQQNGEKAAAGDELWKDEGWLFTKWDGSLMHLDTISKWFPIFLKRHGLKQINFHAIRHTAASLLINQGLNVKALSARLGHANASTTLNICSHAFKSVDREAANMMENIINRKKEIKKPEQA